jgi:hypothetical protein
MSSVMMKTAIILSVAGAALAAEHSMNTTSDDDVMLVTFDGKPGTTFNFIEEGIPTGSWPAKWPDRKSSGTWTVADGHGALDAAIYTEWDMHTIATDVGWPGLIKATADGNFLDASSTLGGALILQVRSTTPEYTGFHITLGTTENWGHASYACGGDLGLFKNRGCYKASFTVPPSAEFVSVRIPFTSFSGSWLYGSGAQYKACGEDKSECLTAKTLAAIKQISIWAEGIAGKPNLQVKSISASPAPSQLVTKLVTMV